jgi:hypothetical protein
MIYLLVFILFTAFIVAQFYECDIIVNPIKGIMLGALYNDEDFDDETDHTIQVLILIISFTFIWTTSNGSKK